MDGFYRDKIMIDLFKEKISDLIPMDKNLKRKHENDEINIGKIYEKLAEEMYLKHNFELDYKEREWIEKHTKYPIEPIDISFDDDDDDNESLPELIPNFDEIEK